MLFALWKNSVLSCSQGTLSNHFVFSMSDDLMYAGYTTVIKHP